MSINGQGLLSAGIPARRGGDWPSWPALACRDSTLAVPAEEAWLGNQCGEAVISSTGTMCNSSRDVVYGMLTVKRIVKAFPQ